MKGKHFTLDERIKIQECICKGYNKSQIAIVVNKSISSVSREIKNNRFKKIKVSYDNPFNCEYFPACKVCTGKCNSFKEKQCLRRDRNIGACNNCPNLKKCTKDHYIYDGKKAHLKYRETLVDAREGVNLTTFELFDIAHVIAPLINQGQSIYVI